MFYFSKLVSGSILFIVMMSSVFAQTEINDETQSEELTQPDESELWGWAIGTGISYFALDEKAAAEQKIGDSAFSWDIFASYYINRRLAASAGFGFIVLDDKAQFSQQVVATNLFGSDDVETATSEAEGMRAYGELLFTATNASSPVQLKGGLGYGTIVSTDRSIGNCSNCRTEDIDLEGGAYGTASVFGGIVDDKYNIGLSARQYFSGDIKNIAMLWVEFTTN